MREGMERVQRAEDAVRSLPATPLKDPEERASFEERASEDERLREHQAREREIVREHRSRERDGESCEDDGVSCEERVSYEERVKEEEIWSFEERKRAGEGSEEERGVRMRAGLEGEWW